jgi:hypothetical protein
MCLFIYKNCRFLPQLTAPIANMAALPLRACTPVPGSWGYAYTSAETARPFVCAAQDSSRAMRIPLLGRRGPSSAPLKIQARTRQDPFRSNCADNLHEPEPEPEPEPENHPLVEETLKKIREAKAEMGIVSSSPEC